MDLAIVHAALIAAFEKEIYDFPVVVVSICTRESQCLLLHCPMTSKTLTYGQG